MDKLLGIILMMPFWILFWYFAGRKVRSFWEIVAINTVVALLLELNKIGMELLK